LSTLRCLWSSQQPIVPIGDNQIDVPTDCATRLLQS
jgi:hypothetical protein